MRTLLSIGDFARMTFLSVKSLRHYHELGLLPPAAIDSVSGYRRYDVSQVPTAQVIRRLRELDMPLEELKVVLQASDVQTRNAAIIAHLQRMEHELQRTQATVASLRNQLEHQPTPIAIESRAVSATNAIAIREHVALDNLPTWLTAAFSELRSVLKPGPLTGGLQRVGPDGGLYENEIFADEHGDVVAFIPIDGSVDPVGRVENNVLPAAEYAVAVHRGSFDNLDQTFAALGTFVTERAISVAGPWRENYLVGTFDSPDEAQFRTEICWPIFLTTSSD
jgi:DNA-binding transcriptional MerR regulator/effector-binding domain-containing protein